MRENFPVRSFLPPPPPAPPAPILPVVCNMLVCPSPPSYCLRTLNRLMRIGFSTLQLASLLLLFYKQSTCPCCFGKQWSKAMGLCSSKRQLECNFAGEISGYKPGSNHPPAPVLFWSKLRLQTPPLRKIGKCVVHLIMCGYPTTFAWSCKSNYVWIPDHLCLETCTCSVRKNVMILTANVATVANTISPAEVQILTAVSFPQNFKTHTHTRTRTRTRTHAC